MSEDNRERLPYPRFAPGPDLAGRAADEGAIAAMRRAVEGVMDVQDITTGDASNPMRVRGTLTMPADQAFAQIRPQFEAVGHTPMLRHEDGLDIARALPVIFERKSVGIPWTPLLLAIATLISVFLIGLGQADHIYELPTTIMLSRLTNNPDMLALPELAPTDEQWRQAIGVGLMYMFSLMGILGAHEFGHYLVARHYGVDTTLPFFIPMPIPPLGTMGAVIAMREPSPNRRIQFDIGVAGPLAGLVVAIPVLLYGLSLSRVTTTAEILAELPPEIGTSILHEGQSLLYLFSKFVVFGEILPRGDLDVWVHPVAFAGWAGLLVTALNLLPIGQLDGGHVLYGLFGDKASKARRPIIIVLVVMAIFGTIRETTLGLPPDGGPIVTLIHFVAGLPIPGWSGWWIWILLITFLIRGHAPVLDEITELDERRQLIGVAVLIIFVLIFTPTPLVIDTEPLASLFHMLV